MANQGERAQLCDGLLGVCDRMHHLTDSASALGARPHGLCRTVASRVLHGQTEYAPVMVRCSWGGLPECFAGEHGGSDRGVRASPGAAGSGAEEMTQPRALVGLLVWGMSLRPRYFFCLPRSSMVLPNRTTIAVMAM
jgi:hypothetical protein